MSTIPVSRRVFVDLGVRPRQSGRSRPGTVIVGVGAAIGDECKARTAYAVLTRLIRSGISPQEIVAARYSGGSNRRGFIEDKGRPDFEGDEMHVSMSPAGNMIPGVTGYLASQVLFDPTIALDELGVKRDGYGQADILARYKVSSLAPLIIETHVVLGQLYDRARADRREGGANSTTGKGIWYALQDAARPDGLRAGDLLRPDVLEQKITALRPFWLEEAEAIFREGCSDAARHYFKEKYFTVNRQLSYYAAVGRDNLADNIVLEESPIFLPRALREGKVVYLEGSQGFGLHPTRGLSTEYCTSTNILVEAVGPSTGIELSQHQHAVLGLFRICATTRHGPGPLLTENITPLDLQARWRESTEGDPWQLPFRVGILDLNLLRASARVNKYTGLVANWLDGFDGLERIPVCDYYIYNGDRAKLADLPSGSWTKVGEEIRLFETFTDINGADIVPHVVELPGWGDRHVAGLSHAEQLPPEAWQLIRYVEDQLNMPESIVILGTGADNSSTIFLRNIV